MLTLIPDETLQGSMVQTYALIEGIRYDKAGGPHLLPRLLPNLIRAELGSTDNVTAAGSATTISTGHPACWCDLHPDHSDRGSRELDRHWLWRDPGDPQDRTPRAHQSLHYPLITP